jgi:hypothetical protein
LKSAALQSAIYTRLNDASVTGLLSTAYGQPAIFSDVPQPADAGADNLFPYITYRVSTVAPFDTDDATGGNAIVQVDCWHRVRSDIALNALADAVDLRLRRQPLTISGVTWITTELESVSFSDDPDGKSKRALMLFRVLYMA